MKDLGNIMKHIIPELEVIFTDISFEDARNYRVTLGKSNVMFKYKRKFDILKEIRKMIKIFEEHRICDVTSDVYHNGNFIKKLNGKL